MKIAILIFFFFIFATNIYAHEEKKFFNKIKYTTQYFKIFNKKNKNFLKINSIYKNYKVRNNIVAKFLLKNFIKKYSCNDNILYLMYLYNTEKYKKLTLKNDEIYKKNNLLINLNKNKNFFYNTKYEYEIKKTLIKLKQEITSNNINIIQNYIINKNLNDAIKKTKTLLNYKNKNKHFIKVLITLIKLNQIKNNNKHLHYMLKEIKHIYKKSIASHPYK
ncbi:MAG: hypothetical protein HYZ30_00385 [Candidatus Azosocius agrarius]|nr:MAG: hypothetical protein HYZ30_00385 [Gammaproteobacteria bacterium]